MMKGNLLLLIVLVTFGCKENHSKIDVIKKIDIQEQSLLIDAHRNALNKFIFENPVMHNELYGIVYDKHLDDMIIYIVKYEHDRVFIQEGYKGFSRYNEKYPLVIISFLKDSLNSLLYDKRFISEKIPAKHHFIEQQQYKKVIPSWSYSVKINQLDNIELIRKDSIRIWHMRN